MWAVLILEFPRHGHGSMGVYLLWMVSYNFRSREPLTILRGDIQTPIQGISSCHQLLLYLEDRPLRSKTYAANDTVELYCPWCESLPLKAAALAHGKPHGTCIQLQLSRLLDGVEQSDRGDEVGEFHPTLGSVHGTTQQTFHRRCRWYPHAKGDKGNEARWKSARSVLRYEQRAQLHKSFH